MRSRIALLGLLAGIALTFGAGQAHGQAREQGKLLTAAQVLEEIRSSRDQFIPDRLLDRAYGIAVVPDVAKVAFIAGGRHGRGVLVVRDKDGNFSNPVFIRVSGGSFGWQLGVQSTDLVLVFTTRKGVDGITDGKLTLGADASVAAGPVGRQASASTDQNFTAEVYSYSRARGLFAGVALDGTAITIDHRANAKFYGKRGVTPSDVFSGAVTTNDNAAQRFLAVVRSSTSAGQTAASASAPGSGSPDPEPEEERPPAAPASGARTFPLEDPNPGAEPR